MRKVGVSVKGGIEHLHSVGIKWRKMVYGQTSEHPAGVCRIVLFIVFHSSEEPRIISP